MSELPSVFCTIIDDYMIEPPQSTARQLMDIGVTVMEFCRTMCFWCRFSAIVMVVNIGALTDIAATAPHQWLWHTYEASGAVGWCISWMACRQNSPNHTSRHWTRCHHKEVPQRSAWYLDIRLSSLLGLFLWGVRLHVIKMLWKMAKQWPCIGVMVIDVLSEVGLWYWLLGVVVNIFSDFGFLAIFARGLLAKKEKDFCLKIVC